LKNAYNRLIQTKDKLKEVALKYVSENYIPGKSAYASVINWKIRSTHDAKSINARFPQGTEPPYKEGTTVDVIELTQDTKVGDFVRVYDNINSFQQGPWLMMARDIAGLTPEQIQDKYALPTKPTYVTDVMFKSGTKLRVGIANKLFESKGGGLQFDTMGEYVGDFINERLLQ